MTPESKTVRPLHVLVVDDDDDGATLMVEMLRLKGFNASQASGVLHALEECGAQRYDVLLADLDLGDGSGLDLAASLKTQGSSPLLISLTGSVEGETRRKCLDAGFDHHFTKPLEWEELLSLLERQRQTGARCSIAGGE